MTNRKGPQDFASCCKGTTDVFFNGYRHRDDCPLGKAAKRLKQNDGEPTWRELALKMLAGVHSMAETADESVRGVFKAFEQWDCFERAREKKFAEEQFEKSRVASLEADHVLSVEEVEAGTPGVKIVNATRMKPLVHALHGGAPLCGFEAGKVPGDWPKGHAWANVNDFANTEREDRCRGCELQIEGSISSK
jgi:hypothetical protein